MEKKRISTFDVAKGIAIIAVLLGHTRGIPDPLLRFCFSFHLPVFYLVSGYFSHKDEKLDAAFVRKQAKATLLPYAITCLLIILASGLRDALFHPDDLMPHTIQWVVDALYGAGGVIPVAPSFVRGIGAIWFLLALFWARIFLAAANRTNYPSLVAIALFVVGTITRSFIWLPWSIQAGMVATLYLYVGQLLREFDGLNKIPAAAWVSIVAAWVAYFVLFGRLWLVDNTFADGIGIDLVGSIVGALAVIKLSDLIAKHLPPVEKPLAAVGRITLAILCMHIVELDVHVIETETVMSRLAQLPVDVWISGFVIRVALVAVLCAVLWFLPRPISGIFYPQRARARESAAK